MIIYIYQEMTCLIVCGVLAFVCMFCMWCGFGVDFLCLIWLVCSLELVWFGYIVFDVTYVWCDLCAIFSLCLVWFVYRVACV